MKGSELIRSGADMTLTDDVEQVLRRSAGTFRGWLENRRAAFV
jgi:hypothetical protein